MTRLVPYQFQWTGSKWLAKQKRAILGDEPGLGKTNQAIIACDLIKASMILVVSPAAARFVWRDEIKKWSMFGHEVHTVVGVKAFEEGPKLGCVNIINYDLFAYGFQKKSFGFNAAMKKWLAPMWDVVINDEAHYLKEKDSLRTRAILKTTGINGRAKRLWFLTGTPMPNHPGELWTLLAACGATKLSYKDFINRYCKVGTFGFSKGQPQGANKDTIEELNKILESVMRRRLKEFVMPELPEIAIHDFPVPEVKIDIGTFFEEGGSDPASVKRKLKAQEEFIDSVWQTSIASGGKMDNSAMIQILESVGPGVAMYRRWLGAVKAASVYKSIIDDLELGAYDKIVIFAHHKQVIRFLTAKLKKYNPQVIDGSTANHKRELAVKQFQESPNCRVFIGNILAAGTALTLTAAHEVLVIEPDWVPANNAQAIMRCHRIGQRNAVRVRFTRLADTLDDYICETLARKTNDIVQVLGDKKNKNVK